MLNSSPFSAALRQTLGDVHCELVEKLLGNSPFDAFVVGGWLRDVLLERPSDDLDLASSRPDELAQALGAAFGRTPVLLDPHRRTWRVPLSSTVHVDVAGLRGALFEDLALRDFRVNAMAWSPQSGLIDPLGGQRDLESRTLSLASPGAIDDDPLRLLRMWRLALELDFERPQDPPSADLSGIAPERVQSELRRILAQPACGWAVEEMHRAGVLHQVLPGTHRVSAFADLQQRQWEARGVQRCLDHVLAVEPGRVSVALGWLVDHPELEQALTEQRWPRRLAQRADLVSSQFGAKGGAVGSLLCSWRERTPWALLGRAAGEDPRAALEPFLDALDRSAPADTPSGRLPELPAPLLEASEIAERLGILPGPGLGRAIRSLVAAQLDGELRTPEEASAWLEDQSLLLP